MFDGYLKWAVFWIEASLNILYFYLVYLPTYNM